MDLGELDEGLVEVLHSPCSIFGRLVTDVSDPSFGEISNVYGCTKLVHVSQAIGTAETCL
jgi:hypothetical protein